MLRCEFCRGHAHAGLAHLHGLSVHLCEDCTRKVLERRKKEEIGVPTRELRCTASDLKWKRCAVRRQKRAA